MTGSDATGTGGQVSPASGRLADALFADAMLLADEARRYFDGGGKGDRDPPDPLARLVLSCESLKVTTRLMHAVAWLLTQRAVEAGEIGPDEARAPSRRLGTDASSDADALARLPADAVALIRASEDLHRRVARLDAALDAPAPPGSPALSMQAMLSRAL